MGYSEEVRIVTNYLARNQILFGEEVVCETGRHKHLPGDVPIHFPHKIFHFLHPHKKASPRIPTYPSTSAYSFFSMKMCKNSYSKNSNNFHSPPPKIPNFFIA